MAKSTGIVLSAGTISFANEWYHTNTPNFKIVMATLGVVLFFDAVDKFSPKAATGLSLMMLVGVLLTPIDGETPAQTVLNVSQGKQPPQKRKASH